MTRIVLIYLSLSIIVTSIAKVTAKSVPQNDPCAACTDKILHEKPSEDAAEKIMPDTPASFDGVPGPEKFNKWLDENADFFPPIAIPNPPFAYITMEVTIDEKGAVTAVKTLQSPDKSLTEKAEALVLTSPEWTPALKDGEPVSSRWIVLLRTK